MSDQVETASEAQLRIDYTVALRAHYEPDSRVGIALDALIADLRDGTRHVETMREASGVAAELANSPVARVLAGIMACQQPAHQLAAEE